MQSITFFYVRKILCKSDEWESASHALRSVKLEQLCSV